MAMQGIVKHKEGGSVNTAIKAQLDSSPDGWIEGYLVSWGNPNDTDLQGEFFTPRTEFCLDWFKDRPVLYHHGLDSTTGLRKVGVIKSIERDDLGLWVKAQLDMRDRYARAVYDMVKANEFGWSSGSVDHLVQIASDGEIAVWPIIEGSVTPTPAQPAKTTVRALKSGRYNAVPNIPLNAVKAVIERDTTYGRDYLRELDARVGNGVSVKSAVSRNETVSKRLARAYASALGVKANDDMLDAIASDVEPIVDSEVAQMAAEELEMEATLQALEDEMIGGTPQPDPTRTYNRSFARNMAKRNEKSAKNRGNITPKSFTQKERMKNMPRNRRSSRRSYRSGDELALQTADELALQMEDELATQMDDMTATMADEIAAEMEAELATQADEIATEKAIARRIRKKALRRAMMKLDATDDIGASLDSEPIVPGGTGSSNPSYLGPTVASMRRRARRNADLPVMGDDYGIMDDTEALLTDEYPVASMRHARRGYARRNVDGELAQLTDDLPTLSDTEVAQLSDEAVVMADPEVAQLADEEMAKRFRRRARRSMSRRGFRSTGLEVPVASDEFPVMADEFPVASYRRARRNTDLPVMGDELDATMTDEIANEAYAKGLRHGIRRAMRTDVTGVTPVLGGISENNSEVGVNTSLGGAEMTTAKALRRAKKLAALRSSRRRAYRNVEDLPVMGDDEAMFSDDFDADDAPVASMRRVNRARRNVEDLPVMGDEEAMFSDDLPVMADEEFPVASYRRARRNTDLPVMGDELDAVMGDEFTEGATMSFRGKSAYSSQADYWRNRAMKAEMSEAPGQRGFKSLSVTDVADRQGTYTHAFKSYLKSGFNLMSPTEQYVLRAKGKTNWGDAKGQFEYGGPGAIKTYYGGSDASAGFAVPPDWVAELNKNVMTQTVMAPECRTRTTTSDRIIQPNLVTTDARRSHAAQVRWPGEVITTPSITDTTEDTYSQVEIPIHVMLMKLSAGNSALEDVAFNLEDEINEAFSEAVAVAYDELIWGGDGQGKLEGIVVNPQVTGHASTGVQTVGGYVATGSNAGIINGDVLKQMLFNLPRGYRQRAKWYMNSNTGLQIATLKDGNGNYLIDQRDDSLQNAGVPDKLLGKPIIYNEYADDISSGAFPIILGDLSRGYIIGKRVDFSIRRFDDSYQAQYDQVMFLGRARLGGQILQPAAVKVLKISAS